MCNIIKPEKAKSDDHCVGHSTLFSTLCSQSAMLLPMALQGMI